MMPQTEETLAGYLSPGGSSSLKKATLPTKPCRVTSSLVGKAFQAAGQAGAALHTMAVLQACQADLLKDLSTGGSIDEGAFSVRPSRRPVPSAVLWLPGFHGEDICGSTSRASRTKTALSSLMPPSHLPAYLAMPLTPSPLGSGGKALRGGLVRFLPRRAQESGTSATRSRPRPVPLRREAQGECGEPSTPS